MELTRTSKAFEALVRQAPKPLLDYASRNGELAKLMGGDFADHRLYNPADGIPAQYVERGQGISGHYAYIALTAQFSTALNLQLIRELLSTLESDGHLYILLPAGYSSSPYMDLPYSPKVYGEPGNEQVICLVRGDNPVDVTEEVDQYTLGVADKTLTLAAGPGVFSGQSLDAGTAALLDVLDYKGGGDVLDLGCGNGVMGLWAGAKGANSVTLLDADLRSLRFARNNAQVNGLRADIVSGDGLKGKGWRGKFDLILCNPPYHSDYSVAKGLIEDGFRALNSGGALWFVVKNPDWYRSKMKTVFGGAKVTEHDGYSIVMAEKRGEARKPAKEQKTTRKHEKRMARSR